MSRFLSTLVFLAIVIIVFMLIRVSTGQVKVTPASDRSINPPPTPCLMEYPGKWHFIAGSQPQHQIINSREAKEAIEQLFPDSDYPKQAATVLVFRHPEDSASRFIEYDMHLPTHPSIKTILLWHTGEEWIELQPPPYDSSPWIEIVNVDLVGFVWECEGWSLYAGASNTEYQSASFYTFYQSRDNGGSWKRISSYGLRYEMSELARIAPPNGARLKAVRYDETRKMLTIYAWRDSDRSLYAYSYRTIISTPIH